MVLISWRYACPAGDCHTLCSTIPSSKTNWVTVDSASDAWPHNSARVRIRAGSMWSSHWRMDSMLVPLGE
ncbi:hypothetical protein [Virgisporangium aurantiacum]|uniref:hypothetical protein n=1 Tax=Virgisporangium aurantiacum TaxID=175570 RepID=UPI00194DC1F3|nr:hypothetical protein [Virgisporangium aurantiacum]